LVQFIQPNKRIIIILNNFIHESNDTTNQTHPEFLAS
jgi:hypothetical protein